MYLIIDGICANVVVVLFASFNMNIDYSFNYNYLSDSPLCPELLTGRKQSSVYL